MRRARSESGSLVMEFALSFPMFILFLLVSFETLRLHYSYIAAQVVANRGVELVRINPCCSQGNQTAAQLAQNLVAQLQTFAQGVGIGGAGLNICITTQSAANNCLGSVNNASSVGQPRQIFLVRVSRTVSLAFGLAPVNVDAIGIGRHEPRSG